MSFAFIRRLFRREDPVPNWAPFFSPSEYQRFHALIRRFFLDQGKEVEIQDGMVVFCEESHQFGLANLAQMCHQSEAGAWPEVIANHFQALADSEQERNRLTEEYQDFPKVSACLGLRLYPQDAVPSAGRFLTRSDLVGVSTVLVFDLPTSIATVQADLPAVWNRTPEELFALGLSYIRDKVPVEVRPVELRDGITVMALGSDDFLAASHCLRLDEIPGCVGMYGSLVAVPHRHTILCYPIADLSVLAAISQMQIVARSLYEQGPGSITPELHWWHEGRFTHLPSRSEDDTVEFRPPQEFTDLLGRLAPPSGPRPAAD